MHLTIFKMCSKKIQMNTLLGDNKLDDNVLLKNEKERNNHKKTVKFFNS